MVDAPTERELRLISLAIAFNVDSCEVEECCMRHGLSYEESAVGDIRRALLEDFGVPGMFPPRLRGGLG